MHAYFLVDDKPCTQGNRLLTFKDIMSTTLASARSTEISPLSSCTLVAQKRVFEQKALNSRDALNMYISVTPKCKYLSNYCYRKVSIPKLSIHKKHETGRHP